MFIAGTNISYYNTSQLLYEKTSIISFSSESVKLYDYDIKYKDVKNNTEKIKKFFSFESITI